MAERVDNQIPRPSEPVSVRVKKIVFKEGTIEEAEPESIPDWAKNANDFMIDLKALAPVQHARLVLDQGPDRGMTVYQPMQMWRSALNSILLIHPSEEHETQLRRAVRLLGQDKWSEDQVHLSLEASKIAAQYLPNSAPQFMLDTLAAAMSDGTTHSTGHALEILLRLADMEASRGDFNGRLRWLRLASRLARTRDWSRYRSQLSSLISALHAVDIEESLSLLSETGPSGEDASSTMLEARVALASGDLEKAKAHLDSLLTEDLTVSERDDALTVELELSLKGGHPQEVIERTGGLQLSSFEHLSGAQMSLRGDALAAIGSIEEARASWQVGASKGSSSCAISLATSLLKARDYKRCTSCDALDHTKFSFPAFARIAYLKGIAHLACNPESSEGADLLAVGLWSADPNDLTLAATALRGRSRERLLELENEFSFRAGSWIVGENGATTPIPGLDVEMYETFRMSQFAEFAKRLVRAEEDPTTAWANYLDEHTRRAMQLADLLWDQKHLFRARRHFLSLVEVLDNPTLRSVAPAQERKIDAMYSVAVLTRALGDHHDAIRWGEVTLANVPEGSDTELPCLIFNLIGNCHYDLEQYEVAAEYQWRSLGVLADAGSLTALMTKIINSSFTDYQVVLSLFNYGNSLERLGSDELPQARFAAAVAFYKVPNPERLLVADHRQSVINSLAASFRLPQQESGEDSLLKSVIRYLHSYAKPVTE